MQILKILLALIITLPFSAPALAKDVKIFDHTGGRLQYFITLREDKDTCNGDSWLVTHDSKPKIKNDEVSCIERIDAQPGLVVHFYNSSKCHVEKHKGYGRAKIPSQGDYAHTKNLEEHGHNYLYLEHDELAGKVSCIVIDLK